MSRFVMVSLVFASVALLMSSAAAQIPDYDYLPDQSISPANSNDTGAFAPVTIEYRFPPVNSEHCGDNIDLKCVDEIYGGMLKTGDLTMNCCKHIVQMGYDCHIRVAKSTTQKNRAKASEALAKNAPIWQKCVSVVENGRFPAAPAPL